MKFYVTATVLALAVGAMSVAVPDANADGLPAAVREAAAAADSAAKAGAEVRYAELKYPS